MPNGEDDPFSTSDRWRELFERHYGSVLRFFRRQGCSREDAEDLTQETFFRAFEYMHDLRDERAAGAWLMSIAASQWKNQLRSRDTRKRRGPRVSVEALAASAPGLLEETLSKRQGPPPGSRTRST